MVVDHARRLHEGVADGRADEVEAALFQILAHGVRFGVCARHLLQRLPRVLLGLAADKLPDVGIKAAELAPEPPGRPGHS